MQSFVFNFPKKKKKSGVAQFLNSNDIGRVWPTGNMWDPQCRDVEKYLETP